MKCSYCGAEAGKGKIYCLVCGTKLEAVKEEVRETVSIEFKRVNPQMPAEQPAKQETEYPRTRAVLDEIFGQEQDWTPPADGVPIPEDEEWEFPVTPCADWMSGEVAESGQPFPTYTTAPLREDVLPVAAPAHQTAEIAPKSGQETALQLPVGRSLLKMILLGLITAGIYPTVIWSRIVTELNITASRNDGKRTMPYFGMLLLAPVTLGIVPIVWMHRFCNRVGGQLEFRKCDFRFGAKDFWLWGVLGSLILVGPFIFTHKLMKAMNLINGHYNTNG